MSTSEKTIHEEHARELLDFVIYGDNTLVKLNETPMPDCDYTIRRCTDAIDSIGSTIKFSSADDVCEECEEQHGVLIDNVEDSHQDVESHYGTIIDAYQELEKQNEVLRRIVEDLVSYAVDAVPDDDLKDFEEFLIMRKLEGKQ